LIKSPQRTLGWDPTIFRSLGDTRQCSTSKTRYEIQTKYRLSHALIGYDTIRNTFTARCCCTRPPYSKEARYTRRTISVYRLTMTSHHHTCPFYEFGERKETLGAKFAFYAYLLNVSIEAKISVVTGTSGLFISPRLTCRNVVPYDSPAFKLLWSGRVPDQHHMDPTVYTRNMSCFLELTLRQLYQLFSDGKASPHDVTQFGETLLHVSRAFKEPRSVLISSTVCLRVGAFAGLTRSNYLLELSSVY
jgi:hypothetical protein